MTALKAFPFLLLLYFHPASFAYQLQPKTLAISEEYHVIITVSIHMDGMAGWLVGDIGKWDAFL